MTHLIQFPRSRDLLKEIKSFEEMVSSSHNLFFISTDYSLANNIELSSGKVQFVRQTASPHTSAAALTLFLCVLQD